MLCSMPFFVLEQILSEADKQPASPKNCRGNASRRRGFCGQYPYPQNSCSELQRFSPSLRQLEVRELDDTYVLFLDMPGLSRSDVTITVEGDSMHISAPNSSTGDDLNKTGPSKNLLVERPRGGIKRSWRLPKDAMLDGIHAKLHNGELTITVPKRKAFSVPVLGADNTDSAALPERAKEPAEALHVPMTEHTPAMESPVKPLVASEPEPVVQTPTAPDQVKLPEAMKETADMADVEESDGSIEDLSEEEREDYAAARRAKGKLPLEGPVLEEIETQEAR